jgi:ribonuclease HI
MIKIFTDGGSRGNPGEAAIGVFITNSKGVPIDSFGKKIGIGTNNEAEYTAVIEALSWVRDHPEHIMGQDKISFYLDSLLVVSQINGLYRVKNPKMQSLLSLVRVHERAINITISYQHIPREQNTEADKQVNMALDNLTH